MKKIKKDTIQAKGFSIEIYIEDFKNDYISLTDIAKYKSDEPNDVIRNWIRGKDTNEFLGLWETLNNPSFKRVEFDGFKMEVKQICLMYHYSIKELKSGERKIQI